MQKQQYEDEFLANKEETFEDNRDVFKYLYQYEKNDNKANLILAYLHKEPKKKKFIRNQRKLMVLVTDFLNASSRVLNTRMIHQNIRFNTETKKIEWLTKTDETQKKAEERIKLETANVKLKLKEESEKTCNFLYNIVESISILERNREDNHFANKGFGDNGMEYNQNEQNPLLQKTPDVEEKK